MTGGEATRTIAGLSLVRAIRGKALYIAAAMIALPIVTVAVRVGLGHPPDEVWWTALKLTLLIMPVVPSILVAPSVADEIEDKTSAYLWSRALPRWSIIAGKVIALAPIAAAIMAVGLAVCWGVIGGPGVVSIELALRGLAGVAGAALAASMLVAALATLVPRHAVAMSVVYLLVVDTTLANVPIKVQYLSIRYAATAVAGYTPEAGVVTGAIILVVLGAVCGYVAVRRMATLE